MFQLLNPYVETWEFAYYYFKTSKQNCCCSLFITEPAMWLSEFGFWAYICFPVFECIAFNLLGRCNKNLSPWSLQRAICQYVIIKMASGKLQSPLLWHNLSLSTTLRNSTLTSPRMSCGHLQGMLVFWGGNIVRLTILLWFNISILVTNIYTFQKTRFSEGLLKRL